MANSFFTDWLPFLEQGALAVVAGAANSQTPIAALDPAHPVVSAATDVALLAGKTASLALPQAAPIASLLLGLAQTWVSAHSAPAPA